MVRIMENKCDLILVTYGVPQETYLEPLLFILYINDISVNLKFARILIYTDDVKVFFDRNSPLDASKLKNNLDCIVSWSGINNFKLNVNKCKVMSFG